MPQSINRVPPGLLSLLGIKSLGQNPVQLNDAVVPMLDLIDFYSENLIQTVTGSVANVNATGQWEFVTSGTRMRPPPGEIWIVRRIGCRALANYGAGTSYDISMCVIQGTTGEPTLVSDPKAGSAGQWPCVSLANFIMTAQSACAVYVHSCTPAVPAEFRYTAQIVALTI